MSPCADNCWRVLDSRAQATAPRTTARALLNRALRSLWIGHLAVCSGAERSGRPVSAKKSATNDQHRTLADALAESAVGESDQLQRPTRAD